MKTIVIDGQIGSGDKEFSASDMRAALEAAAGEPIHVTMHSEGGSVYEGMAIHDMLTAYPGQKSITIQSMAFSIASFVATAFDDIEIAPNGWVMLHNPYIAVEGDDTVLAKVAAQTADLKRKMIETYAAKMNMEPDQVASIMASETFYDAHKAVEIGLANRVTASSYKSTRKISSLHKLPRNVAMALFGNSPEPVKEAPKMSQSPERVAATAKAIKAVFPKAKADFVVKALEKEMTMDEVKDQYFEMTEEEMELLKEQLEEATAAKAAMEEELTAAKAKLVAMEEEMAKAKAAGPQARFRSGAPAVPAGSVGSAGSATVSAKARWTDAVKAKMQNGYNRDKAILAVDREAPELRQAFLAEINS